MKPRTDGFLSEENIPHDSEQFDYIRELHDYLWRFVRVSNPGASGNLGDYIDGAVDSAEADKRRLDWLDAGSELGGAAGSASDLLLKWNKMADDRKQALLDVYNPGIERAMHITRSDVNTLMWFMDKTLKMLAAHAAKQPNAQAEPRGH